MNVRAWLGFQPKQNAVTPLTQMARGSSRRVSDYLVTGGAEILAKPSESSPALTIESGDILALTGGDTYGKHYFCDWLLGFVDVPETLITIKFNGRETTLAKDRTQMASLLGRSPLLYGETIQESLLYRTHDVKKHELYSLIERLYGPSLRARTSAQNPLFDQNGKPVPTQILTAREHLEVAQINLLLQKNPIVILDLSSELMREALDEGFRPARELFESGKTIIVILPTTKDLTWAEELLGQEVSASMTFDPSVAS
jgi:ABC-type uncharacterized transport system YnjBCD ATPase subunit